MSQLNKEFAKLVLIVSALVCTVCIVVDKKPVTSTADKYDAIYMSQVDDLFA